MKEHFFSFMEKIFQNDHAEIALNLKDSEECRYLPIFGVYHPKKPGQIRVVFDSSAKHEGVSLNDFLLSGPDLNNRLLGVLLRFRKDSVADIQQMFYCFLVKEEHQNFLRFLWFRDNNPSGDITEYRMRVHIFGNSPSPAVTIYGLRHSARVGESEYGSDVRQFVDKDFYVDDCLKSLPTNEAAISLLKRTQAMLACSNLRLHKIASNSREVLEAFPVQDHSNELKDIDLGTDSLLMQHSLGLLWDLRSGTFTFHVNTEEKPFTRRGVLSTIKSLYDPLGFAAPVTIHGKALLRDLTCESLDWDHPLPTDKKNLWLEWKDSLTALSNLKIPRPYAPLSSADVQMQRLCVFSDASVNAFAAVAYLKTIDTKGQCHIGFIMGKAPLPEHTIPKLEKQNCTWTFNPPHSSHMGGVWERMIGIARRILDSIFLQVGTARLTHECLVTFMAEVTAIINARPLTSISSDSEDSVVLTPAMLLTQKTSLAGAPAGEFCEKDLYKHQWRQVQTLANTFWNWWREQYISTLQVRRKWHTEKPNLKPGDVVLMKDCQTLRNMWPLGLITKVLPSKDNQVPKVEVKIFQQNEVKVFLRPVTELILLLSTEDSVSDIT